MAYEPLKLSDLRVTGTFYHGNNFSPLIASDELAQRNLQEDVIDLLACRVPLARMANAAGIGITGTADSYVTSVTKIGSIIETKILIEVEQLTLLRNAAIIGVAAFIAAYTLLWLIGLNYTFLAIVLGGGGGYFYFHQMRETIFVKDIMHGRYFTCRSVIELAQKEAELERIVKILRQVMEAAKHWDGTETIEVPVLDKDAAKQLIVQLR